MAAQNGKVHGTTVESNDSKAATAEAEMSQSAGDVGDWLGVDSGGPAPVQVTLVVGMPYPGFVPVSYLLRNGSCNHKCWSLRFLCCSLETAPEDFLPHLRCGPR